MMNLKLSILPYLVALIFTSVPMANSETPDSCDYNLVETLPDKLTYERDISFNMSKTPQVYLDLINRAQSRIQVATFYVTLTPKEDRFKDHPTAKSGSLVLEALLEARKRGVAVEFVISHLDFSNNNDLRALREAGVQIRVLNNTALLGDGVMHSKFIITDDVNFYVGSANWDWRSLSHVKEFGITFNNCQALADDLAKVFKTYLLVSDTTELPTIPSSLQTNICKKTPLPLLLDGIESNVYIGTNPREFTAPTDNRSTDLETILDTINRARKYIYVSVMTFSPFVGFRPKKYWPDIENALRAAALTRGVKVKLLISAEKSFWFDMTMWFRSLNSLCSENQRVGCIEVKFFKVPTEDSEVKEIPHARVKHDKYMVTDNSAYIGTSNWNPDYFINTAGVGISVTPNWHQMTESNRSIVSDMKAIFERDYYSEHIVQVI